MELNNDQLPEDVAAEAATDEVSQETPEGSPETAVSYMTTEQVQALLAQQADQLRRQFQSQSDKLAARLERKLTGDPKQAALRVAREHGIQIPPDKEQQYLDGLKASGALAPDIDDDPGEQQGLDPITAAGNQLALSLGLTREDPESQALFGRTYQSPQEYFAAIQQAGAQKQARMRGVQGAAGQRPVQGQAAGARRPIPPGMVPGGSSTKRVNDNPSWDDVAAEEWERSQRARR